MWDEKPKRTLIYSALHSGNFISIALQDIFDFKTVQSEAGINELIDADGEIYSDGKITYLENDLFLLEDVYFGNYSEGAVFPLDSENADFRGVMDRLLGLIQSEDGDIHSESLPFARDDLVNLLKSGEKKGRLFWCGDIIRAVVSDLFKGQERQRALNSINRDAAMLNKYRDAVLKKYSSARLPEFLSIAPERLIPNDNELKSIVGDDCEAGGYMSLLMESAVNRDWPEWVTKGLDVETSALIENVNQSLSTHLFSDAGYQVVVKSRILMIKEDLVAALEEFRDVDLESRQFYCELSLIDSHGRRLRFSDVGSGIGFVFPILVACYQGHHGLIVQQPELHLHPALQAGLADVFIEAAAGKIIICETHSEHLILRALKRVRQTSAGTLTDPTLALQPSDLAFNYFEPLTSGSTKIHNLRVSEDGDFLDRWPNGFFAERDQELFGE